MGDYILYFFWAGILIAVITKNGKLAAFSFGIAFFGTPIIALIESIFRGHKPSQLLALCIGFMIAGYAISKNTKS